jgi:hypothetical protein
VESSELVLHEVTGPGRRKHALPDEAGPDEIGPGEAGPDEVGLRRRRAG